MLKTRNSRIRAIVAATAIVMAGNHSAYAAEGMDFPTGLPVDEAEDGLEFDLGVHKATRKLCRRRHSH